MSPVYFSFDTDASSRSFLLSSLLSYSSVFSTSTWSCLLFHKNGFSLVTYLLFSPSIKCISVFIMISLPSCLRERNVRPDTSTRTLEPSFLTFSRTLTHKFLLVIFSFSTNSFPLVCIFSHLTHTHWKIYMSICWLLTEWISRSFLNPGFSQTSSFCYFPIIAVLVRVVYTGCVSLPSSHLFLNLC